MNLNCENMFPHFVLCDWTKPWGGNELLSARDGRSAQTIIAKVRVFICLAVSRVNKFILCFDMVNSTYFPAIPFIKLWIMSDNGGDYNSGGLRRLSNGSGAKTTLDRFCSNRQDDARTWKTSRWPWKPMSASVCIPGTDGLSSPHDEYELHNMHYLPPAFWRRLYCDSTFLGLRFAVAVPKPFL